MRRGARGLWWSGEMTTCDFETHRRWSSDEAEPLAEWPCDHTAEERAEAEAVIRGRSSEEASALVNMLLRKEPRALVQLPASRSARRLGRRFRGR